MGGILSMFVLLAPAVVAVRPPAEMHVMVRVLCSGSFRGWATPYQQNYAITAAHVLDKCFGAEWERQGKRGYFITVREKLRQTKEGMVLEDFAIVRSAVSFDAWAVIAKDRPKAGDILWHRNILAGDPNYYGELAGLFIGRDGQGHMHVDSTVHPGSSGSGWFNANGEVVGVVNGHFGINLGRTLAWGTSVKEIFD